MRLEQLHSPDNLFAPKGQGTADQAREIGGSTSKRKEMKMTDVKFTENPSGVSGDNEGRFMGRFAHCLHAPHPFFHTGKVHRAKLGKLFLRKRGTVGIVDIRAFGRRLYA